MAARTQDWRASAAHARELYRQWEARRTEHTDQERDDAIAEVRHALLALKVARPRAAAVGTDGFELVRRYQRPEPSAMCATPPACARSLELKLSRLLLCSQAKQ